MKLNTHKIADAVANNLMKLGATALAFYSLGGLQIADEIMDPKNAKPSEPPIIRVMNDACNLVDEAFTGLGKAIDSFTDDDPSMGGLDKDSSQSNPADPSPSTGNGID